LLAGHGFAYTVLWVETSSPHVCHQRQSSALAVPYGISNLCRVSHARPLYPPGLCLYDFTRTHTIAPGEYYGVSGKVNSADKLYLVIESVKSDTKHNRDSAVPASADGAGESLVK
jgi:hypothetical protein